MGIILKPDICTRVYSITCARVRIVYDKSYRVDRPLVSLSELQVTDAFFFAPKMSDIRLIYFMSVISHVYLQ